MPCNCGGSKTRQTITSGMAEEMRQAALNGDKYVVKAPDGSVAYSGSSYLEAARAKRSTGGVLANVR